MWVRIKGVLYNLSLVQSIDFNAKTHSIQLIYTGVIPYTEHHRSNYRNDSAWIEFEFQALIQKGKMTDIFLEGK